MLLRSTVIALQLHHNSPIIHSRTRTGTRMKPYPAAGIHSMCACVCSRGLKQNKKRKGEDSFPVKRFVGGTPPVQGRGVPIDTSFPKLLATSWLLSSPLAGTTVRIKAQGPLRYGKHRLPQPHCNSPVLYSRGGKRGGLLISHPMLGIIFRHFSTPCRRRLGNSSDSIREAVRRQSMSRVVLASCGPESCRIKRPMQLGMVELPCVVPFPTINKTRWHAGSFSKMKEAHRGSRSQFFGS